MGWNIPQSMYRPGGSSGDVRKPTPKGVDAAGAGVPSVSTMSIYEQRVDTGDHRRVLVTRHYPRGVRKTRFDEWCRALAPSAGLLRRYKDGGIAFGGFADRFLAEVSSSREAQDAVPRLREAARTTGIVLLCYEPDGAPCHRHILRDMIMHAGPPRRPGRHAPDYTDRHQGRTVSDIVGGGGGGGGKVTRRGTPTRRQTRQ